MGDFVCSREQRKVKANGKSENNDSFCVGGYLYHPGPAEHRTGRNEVPFLDGDNAPCGAAVDHDVNWYRRWHSGLAGLDREIEKKQILTCGLLISTTCRGTLQDGKLCACFG